MEVQADPHEQKTLVFDQHLSKLGKVAVLALDKFPVLSGWAYNSQTSGHVPYHESLITNLAFLQKGRHNPPTLIQIEETLQQTNHGLQPSLPYLVTKDLT